MAEEKPGVSAYGKASNRGRAERESEREMFGVYRHFEMLSNGRRAPLSKAMDRYEGLSCLSGDPWSEPSAKADAPWQFGPGGSPLDFESQFINVEESSLSDIQDIALADLTKASESELEWQWIMYQQQASKCEWFSSTKVTDSSMKEDAVDVLDKDGQEDGRPDVESSTTSSLFSGSKIEGSSDAGTIRSSKVSGNLSVELNAARSSQKPSAVWLTADSKELAALVSQKGHGYLENCDLPPSQSSLTWKGPLARCDTNPSKAIRCSSSLSSGKVLQVSACRGYESTSLEHRSLPSSPFVMSLSGPTQMCDDLPNTAQPQPIPSVTEGHSSIKSYGDQTRSLKNYSGGHADVTKRGFEALGEALCHSQTRARQAEKLASQALQEREKLARLLLRESWTARTYKQWVQTLELENAWLKMCAENDMDVLMMSNEFSDPPPKASDLRVPNPYKHVRKRAVGGKKMERHFNMASWQGRHHQHRSVPESHVWLHCTIGLAFALGLSFAGAGLMIGWSMGWILLAY